MKYFKSILFLAVGLSLSTGVAYSQDTPDEQPVAPVEAYAKTLEVKPCTLDVMVIERMPAIELEISNFAITTKESTALAYVPELPTYAENTAKYRSSIISYSAIHKGRLIQKTIKAPPIYS